jgi:hypothetical protein
MSPALDDDLTAFAWILDSRQPLIVCDVDEVTLEFVDPFTRYLATQGLQLLPRSFRLHGNIVSNDDGTAIDREAIGLHLDRFFAEQDRWQRPVHDVVGVLERLATRADVIFLTAMPPQHFDQRRALLDAHGLPYPMIATASAKGAILDAIHGARASKVVFVDDIYTNLQSVRDHVPEALLVNFMAHEGFRSVAPHPGDGVLTPTHWIEVGRLIEDFIERDTPPA